ncbi:hypothetical protein BIW11_12985 [Tropilaelaps mercedesae]|uniref:Uncharacterized protein n=1 Tax=Tropilaelaps mercedesae TaxID=418985 RepID=A0A1V9X4K3_9ACAR|nr:hypothetical protein BIW11_12985 [Tropilaelaps mercedesae]
MLGRVARFSASTPTNWLVLTYKVKVEKYQLRHILAENVFPRFSCFRLSTAPALASGEKSPRGDDARTPTTPSSTRHEPTGEIPLDDGLRQCRRRLGVLIFLPCLYPLANSREQEQTELIDQIDGFLWLVRLVKDRFVSGHEHVEVNDKSVPADSKCRTTPGRTTLASSCSFQREEYKCRSGKRGGGG